MIILQGNTYLLPIQVRDCNDNVITADKVTKGQFIFGKYEKFYGEEGKVQWSEQLQAFLFPLTEQETFELTGVIKYQARLLLNDGSVSGSVPENYYVYESITKNIISNGEVGQESGALLKVKLVMPVVSENNGSSGTTDYNELKNKPSINGVELEGNKTTEDLGIVSKETDPTVPQYVKDITEQDIENWNNKSDFSGSYNDLTDKPTNNATTGYVDQKVADLVNSAPETLDTLGEVAKAIEENADVVEALNSAIGSKAGKDYVDSSISAVDNKITAIQEQLPVIALTQIGDNEYSLDVTTSETVAEALDNINGEVI